MTQRGTFRSLSGSFDMKEEPLLNPDHQIVGICHQSILKKMQKESYGHLCEKYGRGHVLVVIPYQTYPLVNRDTVQHVESTLSYNLLKQQCNFRSLWITHKQPEVGNRIIVHAPAATLRYAFYSLWPERKFYIVELLISNPLENRLVLHQETMWDRESIHASISWMPLIV